MSWGLGCVNSKVNSAKMLNYTQPHRHSLCSTNMLDRRQGLGGKVLLLELPDLWDNSVGRFCSVVLHIGRKFEV